MGKRTQKREWSLEEYQEWSDANTRVEQIKETADEVGGPQLSLVPIPTDVAPAPEPDNLDSPIVFDPEPSRLRYGWSAYRQRVFILSLAETGSVHQAAKEARMSGRGTPLSSSPSAACPPSPSIGPSTAGRSKSMKRACWSASGASRTTGW